MITFGAFCLVNLKYIPRHNKVSSRFVLLAKLVFLLCILCPCYPIVAQQNSIFISSFFKDQLLNPGICKTYQGSGFLPSNEGDFDLNRAIRDSSKQFYELTSRLFKKHLFEIKGNNYSLNISPILDFARGQDQKDSSDRRLFQNTRGIYIEGDLTSKFSFSTAILENQSRYSSYETAFYTSIGEHYPNQAKGTYSIQNAVIPGAGRTKPFKKDGFDYAYAIGNINYRPVKSVLLTFGNNTHFVGDGYRSLLLSDNAVPAPYLRGIFRISDQFEFNFLRMRLLNLIRRPVSSTVESYYESKGYSANYLTFKPSKKFTVSLFEGMVWSRGDSLTSRRVHPLFYSPVPGTALAVLSKNELNYLLGLNLSYVLVQGHRAYGQLAYANGRFNKPAIQLGIRLYHLMGQPDLMLQVEYNNVPKGMYENGNPRLSFSHYNLPIHTIKGSGFEEWIFRLNYDRKRWYLNEKVVFYKLSGHQINQWMPVYPSITNMNGNITLNQVEAGYRFNRKMNLCLFLSWQVRNDKSMKSPVTNLVFIGLRTGIINHYNDF